MASQPDCLFCKLVREGEHVNAAEGFVAIEDINPKAPVHLLVLPERHVDTFRDVSAFEPDEAKRMLEFVADTREERGPRGLSGRRQRGTGGGPDRLPSALACARRREAVRMSLIARIEDELKAAMRARDQERTDTLRMTLSSLRAAEKDLQRPLKEDEELQVLQRERKRRTEAAEAFRDGDRPEQADKEDRELAVIEEFMPEPMSEEAIEQIIDDAIAETGATSLRDLGRVMADVMPQVAGRADGSTCQSARAREAGLGSSPFPHASARHARASQGYARSGGRPAAAPGFSRAPRPRGATVVFRRPH